LVEPVSRSIEDRVREIIEIAISNENNAEAFYREAAEKVKLPHARKALEELADEEVGHAEFLRNLLQQGFDSILEGGGDSAVDDLQIVEYLSVPELNVYSNYQEILTVAMHREKIAMDFYNGMAAIVREDKLKRILEKLAAVELGHKERLERMYEEEYYQEF